MLRRTFTTLAAGVFQKAPLGIGFLGVSHAHGAAKLETVRANPEWRLVGVSEPGAKLAESLRARGIALLSREELLRHPEIRAIAVESPVRDHAADGLAVLEAGKHLHLEKAPAADMAGFRKIVDAARRRKLLVQVGYMWRYHPAIARAIEAARQGWLGRVYMVRACIGNLLEPARRQELAEFPGGVMFELGGHVIDAVTRMMGKPLKVTPFLRTDGGQDQLRDNTAAVLEWPRAIGLIHGATLQPNSFRYRALEVHGAGGCAIVNPIEPPVLTMDLAKPAGPYRPGVQKIEVPAYRRYVDDFVELAAAVRGETALRVTLEEDLAVHETLLRSSGMWRG
ncbi:MAG: Gfo/Idh/MocA family protein [Bryobacteraceae bacterium]